MNVSCLSREVGGERFEGPQRWEVAPEIRVHQLEDTLGSSEVPKTMLAQVHQFGL
jgi:hypothetical protein